MGTFRCVSVDKAKAVRSAGTYVFQLLEVQAGLLDSKFHETPQPTFRFIFEDDEGKVAAFSNIPLAKNRELGLVYSKGRFWEIVGALWGRYVETNDSLKLSVDISGVNSFEDLSRMPVFFAPGVEPISGVRIFMGNEEIGATGRKLLLTLKQRPNSKGEMVNVVAGYAPAPMAVLRNDAQPLSQPNPQNKPDEMPLEE